MIHHVKSHIHSMRQKPHHIKRQYAFLVSFCITLVIFLFWMMSFGARSVAIEQGVKPPTPLSAMTAGVGDAFSTLKGLIFGANKTEYSSDNVEVVGTGN